MSDKELWQLVQKGHKDAFSLLYNRHVKSLLHFGRRLTDDQELIKDSLQELFTDFWKNRNKLSAVEHVKVYLIKSYRYKLLRAISKSNKSKVYSLDDLLKDFNQQELGDTELSIQRKRKLKEQIKNLPDRQREVIHLRYFQNLMIPEIAEIINVNNQSVSNLLHRAMKNLRKNLASKKV